VPEPVTADERSVRRRDARDKVTGHAMYAVDSTMANMAHAVVVRSDRAHARITNVDRQDAQAAPGVLGVLISDDLEGIRKRFGHIIPDHPILAVDKVRYYGEPVALVVAETLHEASDAADLVWAEYEDLPPLMTAADALASDVLIHEESYREPGEGFLDVAPTGSGNIAHEGELSWGDVDAAMATAATVVENSTRFPLVYGFAMETYNAVADWQPGDLHVISTAQHPVMVRKDLAKIFSLPLSRVRVEVPFIGGGYGSKSYTKLEPLASVGSWCVGRPVKVTTDIEAAINTTRADGAFTTVRTGFDDQARIVARDISIQLDTGAYADNSPLVLTKSINRAFGPYRVPNLRVRGVAVYTNTSPASSYRGFGAPQGSLAAELNLDIAAAQLGIDPVELRRRNLVGPGEVLIAGKRPLDGDLAADLDAVVAALDEHQRADEPGLRRARGVALSASDAGASPISTAHVRMHADGSVTLLTSSTEMGQGSRTALAQIVARELGVELSSVAVGQSDTLFTPFEWTTGASRTTTLVGLAIQAACDDLWNTLRARAAETAGCDVDEVTARDGLIHAAGKTAQPAEVIRAWFGGDAGEFVGVGVTRREGATAVLPPFWELGVVGVEVAVNVATGEVTVEHLVVVGDVGHAINPGLVKGQDLGAATQGLGIALWEELLYEGEQLTNPNLVEYRVPRFRDMPRRISSVIAERGDGAGPYGAKGGGEGALNPVPAAIAAAVGRAVGVWPEELPLTPARVWALLQTADRS
jgi:CO/xanthine dehydrogenase Mo-binding subunit